MTPTDILAAARLSPLLPVVPAREEWLKGWIGPSQPDQYPEAMAIRDGAIVDDAWVGMPRGIWLDLRRPEVRDRLVRCGAPEWCRDSVAGMLAWAMSGVTRGAAPWTEDNPGMWWRHPAVRGANAMLHSGPVGWAGLALKHPLGHLAHGTETGPDGRAACDLDSLERGCMLEEPDGWYIPLPGGAVGWLPKETA